MVPAHRSWAAEGAGRGVRGGCGRARGPGGEALGDARAGGHLPKGAHLPPAVRAQRAVVPVARERCSAHAEKASVEKSDGFNVSVR